MLVARIPTMKQVHISRTIMIASSYDAFGKNYMNYNFSFTIPEILTTQNDNVIKLIESEIRQESWNRLKQFDQNGKMCRGDCLLYHIPQEDLNDVGESSANTILTKYTNQIEIDNAYNSYVKEMEELKKNSCGFCGRQKKEGNCNCYWGISLVFQQHKKN